MVQDTQYVLEQLAIWFGLFLSLAVTVVIVGASVLYIIGAKLEANAQKETNASQANC